MVGSEDPLRTSALSTRPLHVRPTGTLLRHAHQIDVLWVCTVSAPVSQWTEASPLALAVIDAFRVDSD